MEFVGNDMDATFRLAERQLKGFDESRKLAWLNLSHKDTGFWFATIFMIVNGDEVTAAQRADELNLIPVGGEVNARIFTAVLDNRALDLIAVSTWVDKTLTPQQAHEFDAWCDEQGISKA
jgi:hypothetical protein